MKKLIQLNVNGDEKDVMIEDHYTLLEVLRKELYLTGTKRGCDHGECAACTVMVDGKAILACSHLAIEMQAKKIETIEGLTAKGELHPLQQSFLENGAVQCGFCTPGMIMTSKALLDAKPNADIQDIKRHLGGNFCRCTGYNQIMDAVEKVAKTDGAA